MIEIPPQLQDKAIRHMKIRPQTKKPQETGWTLNVVQYEQQPNGSWRHKKTEELFTVKDFKTGKKKTYFGEIKNYPHDAKEFKEYLRTAKSYGVACGNGDIAGVDADAYQVQQAIEKNLKETLTVQSGGVSNDPDHPIKLHYYYKLKKPTLEKTIPLTEGKETNVGHLRWFGGQLVGPGSIHENGNTYKVVKDIPIAEIEQEELLSVLSQWIRKKKLTTNIAEKQSAFEGMNVQDIVPTTGFESMGGGEYKGAHPFHSSETGTNFSLNPTDNSWYCFHHNVGGSVAELIAMEAGILDCADCGPGCLPKEKFKQVLKVAQEKYGLKISEKPKEEIVTTKLNFKKPTYFAKLKKDKRFIIDEVIYPGTINMLYSKPGEFKSLIALDAAISITNKRDFLGFTTKKYPIIYLDHENNEQIIKERLLMLCNGKKIKRKNFPLLFLVREGDLDNLSFVESLKKEIIENKVKLIIFDTLHRFAQYEENRADDINRLYTKVFVPIVDECDCAILFLHHATKQGEYRGSGDLLGMVDVGWSLKKWKDDKGFTIENIKSRSREIMKINGQVERNDELLTTTITRLGDAVDQNITKKGSKKLNQVMIHIMKLFVIPGTEQKRTFIFDNFEFKYKGEYSEATIRRGLEQLVGLDFINTDKKGKFVRTNKEWVSSE